MESKNVKGCIWYDSLFNCYRWSRPYLKQDEYIGVRTATYGKSHTKKEALIALQLAEELQQEWRDNHEAS